MFNTVKPRLSAKPLRHRGNLAFSDYINVGNAATHIGYNSKVIGGGIHAVERSAIVHSFIITKPMRYNILGVAACFLIILMSLIVYIKGLPSAEVPTALTAFFTIFVMLQFWNLFNASVFGTNHSVFKDSRHALGMISVAGIILIGQIIIVEFGGKVFRTVPLTLTEWLYIIGATSLVLWVGEIWRWIQRLKK